jgi:hypothetical protein
MWTVYNWLRIGSSGVVDFLEHTDEPVGIYWLAASGSIPGTTRKKVVDLERGPLNLVSTTEELLDRKVAAPV